jgi:hypothetical protein
VQWHKVIVLIDGGASHNFIDTNMVERRGIRWVHSSHTRRPPDELHEVDFQVDNNHVKLLNDR